MSSYGNRRYAQPMGCCEYAIEQITADCDFSKLERNDAYIANNSGFLF